MKWIKEHPVKVAYIIGGAMIVGSLIAVIPWSPWLFFVIGVAILFFTTVFVLGD